MNDWVAGLLILLAAWLVVVPAVMIGGAPLCDWWAGRRARRADRRWLASIGAPWEEPPA